jgi:hypothetical protein
MEDIVSVYISDAINLDSDAVVITKLGEDNYGLCTRKSFIRGETIIIDSVVTNVKIRDSIEYPNTIIVPLWATKLLLAENSALNNFLARLCPRSESFTLETVFGGHHLLSLITFINHSCRPNCIITPISDKGCKLIM